MTDHVSGKELKRAELARRTGCNLETIRYYEKIGVMPVSPSVTAVRRCDRHLEGLHANALERDLNLDHMARTLLRDKKQDLRSLR